MPTRPLLSFALLLPRRSAKRHKTGEGKGEKKGTTRRSHIWVFEKARFTLIRTATQKKRKEKGKEKRKERGGKQRIARPGCRSRATTSRKGISRFYLRHPARR